MYDSKLSRPPIPGCPGLPQDFHMCPEAKNSCRFHPRVKPTMLPKGCQHTETSQPQRIEASLSPSRAFFENGSVCLDSCHQFSEASANKFHEVSGAIALATSR